MHELKHSLFDFPDDPSTTDWQKEALLFYYYMLDEEKKYENKVQKTLQKFKEVFEDIQESGQVERKTAYNELKFEIYNIKKGDNNFSRSLLFILLTNSILNNLENIIESILSKKSQLESLKNILPEQIEIFDKELKDLDKSYDKAFTKTTNNLIRVVRTESWRFANEQRLEEFRKKGYKYKTTYPVKDDRTGEDSWDYYDMHQVKPLEENFSYTWKGEERIFMTPPDRPNDRNILIPYTGNPADHFNEIK